MKKRILSLVMAFAILLTNVFSGTFPVFASAADADPVEPILISDGSSKDGWTIERGTLLVNNDQGYPKPSIQVGAGYGALRKLVYTVDLDLSKNPTIEWDWFVMVEGAATDAFEMVVEAYKKTTAVEVSDGKTTETLDISKWELVKTDDKWRHFAVSLADTELNLASIKSICFQTCPVEGGTLVTAVPNLIYRLDNIQATDKEVKPNMGEEEEPEPPVDAIVISDGESITGWSSEASSSGLSLAAGRGPDGSNAIYAAGGYGLLRKLTYTPAAPMNLGEHATLEWDMLSVAAAASNGYAQGQEVFEDVANAYSGYIAVEVSDGTKTAVIPYAKWQVGAVGTGNYRRFAVSMDGYGLDLTKFTSVSFYVMKQDAGGAANTSLPQSVIYRFDNVTATTNTVTPNTGIEDPDDPTTETVVITDCDSVADWSSEVTTSGLAVATGRGTDGGDAVYASGGYGVLRKLTYNPADPIDLKDMTTLEWDMQTVCGGAQGDFALGQELFDYIAKSYGKTIGVEVTDGVNTAVITFDKWQVGDAGSNNYRHFAVSLKDYNLDLSKIDAISFYVMKVEANGKADNTLPASVIYRFDNITATTNAVTPNGTTGGGEEEPDPDVPTTDPVVITDCDSVSDWSSEVTTSGLSISAGRGTDGGDAIYAAGGYGLLRKLTYNPADPIDLKENTTLEWDMQTVCGGAQGDFVLGQEMFAYIAKAYGSTIGVEVTDGSKTAVITFDKWQVGDAAANNYRHFAVSLEGYGLDLSKIDAISFYVMKVEANGKADNTLPASIMYRFDNIVATKNTVTPNGTVGGGEEPENPSGTVLITDCDNVSDWSTEAPGSAGLSISTGRGTDGGDAIYAAGGYGLLRKLTYNPADPIDLKENTTLEWDMQTVCGRAEGDYALGQELFDYIAKAYGSYIGVEVTDGSKTAVITFDKWQVGDAAANNYRHFAVSLEGYGLDLSKIDAISFYVMKQDAGGASSTSLPASVLYRFDNIIATKNTVTPNTGMDTPVQPAKPLVITDCNEGPEEESRWSYKGTSGYGGLVNRGGRTVVHVGATKGALRELTYTPSQMLDLSDYNTIEWVMMIAEGGTIDAFDKVTSAYASTTKVIIEDDTHSVEFPLSVWNVGENISLYRAISVYVGDSDLNMASIKSITFTTAPTGVNAVDSCPEVFVRIDQILAKITDPSGEAGDPEGVWTIPGSTDRTHTGPSNFAFEITGFDHDLSGYAMKDLYLTMRIYVENRDEPGNIAGFGTDGQVELTSSGGPDTQELSWAVSRLSLVPGWNNVRLSLANSAANNGLNLKNVNYFRIYATVSGTATYEVKVEDVKLMADTDHSAFVSTFFSNGMMFQRNKPMNVFGNLDSAGIDVKAELLDKTGAVIETKETASQSDGTWKVAFAARPGSYDKYSIRLYVDGELKKTIENILIGELWLTAGQSNMEYYVIQAMPNYTAPIPTNQYVRFFDEPVVPGGVSAILPTTPATDIPEAIWRDGSNGANAKYVSAIGYFMSLELQETLNVPVGFIHASKGASLIESWLPRSVIEGNEIMKSTLQTRGLYLSEAALGAKAGNWENMTTLYNAKIAPFAGINIAGMLWYQGESNVKYADANGDNAFYAEALKALIETYSKDFGFNGDMPFVYAHLAPHDYSTAPGRGQDYPTILANFSETLSETVGRVKAQMIQLPVYDLSLQYKNPPANNPDPIHPNSKIELAGRFATAVLSGVYGIGDADAQTAPTVSSWKVEGNKIILTYANVGSGLKILDGSADLTGFAIAGSDRVFVKASAKIVGKNQVELSSDAVESPVAATYAWTSFNMRSNLANAAGIPAVPYRTDKTASTYYLSMDWADFDTTELWINLTTQDAGFKPAYTYTSGASVAADSDKMEGKAAIRLRYIMNAAGTAQIAPVLNHHGMLNQYAQYTGLTVHVKNPDNRTKDLSLKITSGGKTYYATVITGEELGTTYALPTGGYGEYTFNLAYLVDAEGNVLMNSEAVLSAMTELAFCVGDTQSGSVLLDNAYLRTDKLPSPGIVDEDANRIMISECETTDEWSYEQTSQTLVSVTGRTRMGLQVFTGYGSLRRLKYTETLGRDFSNYHKISFDFRFLNTSGGADMWESVKTSYKNYIGVEISDGVSTEKFKLADMEIVELGSSWYRAYVEVPSDSKVDLAKFSTFTFYALPMGTGNPDTTLPNMNFQIDNLAAYESAGKPGKKTVTSTYFSDGMLFQQNKPMNVFGNAGAAGATIRVELIPDKGGEAETRETVAKNDGSWSVSFAGRAGSYDTYHMDLYLNGYLTQTIKNVAIGELWLAAGQSNMEYFVWQTIPGYDPSLVKTNANVRFFDIPLVPGGTTATLPAAPAGDIEDAFWSDGSTVDNVKYVSAIAYYMSLTLEEQLGVPVGFINAAKGASLIESWIPRSAIESDSVIKDTLTKRGLYKTEEALDATASNWTYLTTLYNAKVAPYAGISIAGMLWYQGESNVKYADDDGYNTFYNHALKALINTYSKDFGFENGGMPFVCAHLAPYNNRGVRAEDYTTILATFAEMLTDVAGSTSAKMIQIPIYDLSLDFYDPPTVNPDPIHPNSKQAVADRFATAVLSGVYGSDDGYTAPTVTSCKVSGNKVVLTFKNVGSGLQILSGTELKGFAVAGSDRVFVKANAKITSSNTVEVWSDYVTAPVAATYGWSSFNMASNLANGKGIPAVPYRSDKVASTYYLSMDWADFDALETWDALTTTDAGFKPAYNTSDGATVAQEKTDKVSGTSAVRLNYTGKGASLSPVLNYGGMINQYSAYSGFTVSVKNADSRTKTLRVEIVSSGAVYTATIVTGTKLATEYELSGSEYGTYTFNLQRLVDADGKVLGDSTIALKQMTELRLCVTDTEAGSVLFDELILRADKLPAPGSEDDEITDGPEDTTAGSLDADGNMWVSTGDTADGWSASGQLVVDPDLKTQGSASVGTSSENGVLRQIVFSPGRALDISDYDYMEFDVYFSNMKWYAPNNVMFELTSSGGPDQQSDRYMKGKVQSNNPEFAAAAEAATSEPGWYHIKLPLNDPQGQANGGLDKTGFNYFRFYATGAPAGSEDFIVRFDNMKFTKIGNAPVVSKDPAYGKEIDDSAMWLTDGEVMGYWSANGAQVQLDTAHKTQGDHSVSVTAKGGLLRQLAYIPDFSIDISAYQYLEFDAYFTNLDWYFATNSVMFELTSAGTSDNESNRYTKSSMLEGCPEFASDVEAGKGGGKWYHFKLNLDMPHAKVKGGLDKTRFNFFRFYTVEVKDGTPDYTLYLDNLRFTKGEPVPPLEKTAEHIIINNCDSAAGWTSPGQEVLVDRVNKLSGTGSVRVIANGGNLKELVYRPQEPIDLSGYRYLQFDLYLSNITCLNRATGFMVELTSSGTCDVASNRYMKSAILLACPELAEDLAAGNTGGKWYHFCFDLSKPQNQARGGLDMRAFNYFRIYFIGCPAGTPSCIVNVDNLKVTVTGTNLGNEPTGGQILFPSSGSAGNNIGNKINGGLLGEAYEPVSNDGLMKTVIAMGGVSLLLLLCTFFLLIFFRRKKPEA